MRFYIVLLRDRRPTVRPKPHRRSLSPAMFFKQHALLHDAHSPSIFNKEDIGYVVDAQTGMLPGVPESAVCVQRFDDSLNLTIHTTYRNSLRSSSLREPRHPLLAVVYVNFARHTRYGLLL